MTEIWNDCGPLTVVIFFSGIVEPNQDFHFFSRKFQVVSSFKCLWKCRSCRRLGKNTLQTATFAQTVLKLPSCRDVGRDCPFQDIMSLHSALTVHAHWPIHHTIIQLLLLPYTPTRLWTATATGTGSLLGGAVTTQCWGAGSRESLETPSSAGGGGHSAWSSTSTGKTYMQVGWRPGWKIDFLY